MTDEKKKAMDLEFERLDRNADATRQRLEYLEEVYAKSGGDRREVQKTLNRWRSLDEARSLYEKEIQAALAAARTQETLESSPTPQELAATDPKIIDISAFQTKKSPVIGTASGPTWGVEAKRVGGTRFHSSETISGWALSEGNDKIKVRRGRHRVDFTWHGKGLEANGVLLFVDGVWIEDVDPELYAGTNSMRLFFVLPYHAGEELPLPRYETCLEDDGSVRIQLWTKK